MKHVILFGLVVVACGGSSAAGGDDKPSNGGGGSSVGGSAGSGVGGTPVGGAAGVGGTLAGGAAGVAGSGAVAGTGNVGGTCAQITADFNDAKADAKVCDPANPAACTKPIDGSPAGCGYYELVDAQNTPALAEIEVLRNDFQANQCNAGVYCAVGGFSPQTAKCEPSGQGGAMGICTIDN
jgi:hypothetical protein